MPLHSSASSTKRATQQLNTGTDTPFLFLQQQYQVFVCSLLSMEPQLKMQAGPKILKKMWKCFPFPWSFCQYFGNRSTLLFLFSIFITVLSIFWQQKHSSVSIFHFHGCSVNILATEALFSFCFPSLWLFCQYFGNRSTLLIQTRAPRLLRAQPCLFALYQ